MFRLAAFCVALGLAATPALADSLTFEPTHTSVVFQYAHFGLSHPSGKIMGATGTLILDDKDLSRSTVDITLDMRTLTTALPDFDALLKGADYFDIARFPTATFKSTKVELTGETTANVSGDLTIHGVSRSEVLAVTFNKKAFNPALFKTGYGFSATAHLSRKAFGLGHFEPIVGDEIDLIIDAEAY
ncbi:Protein YceI [Asticcacaulis sp. MM231]|uniref:YceI family protein n=1 Tax=Asticcacaulis sp. MM231 TaxID=3157666 RepID=UPI0032D598DE